MAGWQESGQESSAGLAGQRVRPHPLLRGSCLVKEGKAVKAPKVRLYSSTNGLVLTGPLLDNDPVPVNLRAFSSSLAGAPWVC